MAAKLRLVAGQTAELNAEQREAVLAATIRYLIDVDHNLALALADAELLEARAELIDFEHVGPMMQWQVRLAGPAASAATLERGAEAREDENGDVWPATLEYAFTNCLPDSPSFPSIEVETAPVPTLGERVAAKWRNQGVLYPGPGSHEDNGLRYRSATEVRVAKALDVAGVMFLPLPAAVCEGLAREPDFLVITMGRIGVLEVDGPTHTPLTKAQEDARAAWFQQSGVFVHHASVKDVDADVAGVVRGFLDLMKGPVR